MSNEIEMEVMVIEGRQYISPATLAERWGTTTSYLANRRHDKRGLPYAKLGGRVMYELAVVQKYEKDRTILPEE